MVHLPNPLQIGSIQLSNRLVMPPPMARSKALTNGEVSQL